MVDQVNSVLTHFDIFYLIISLDLTTSSHTILPKNGISEPLNTMQLMFYSQYKIVPT